MRRMAPPPAARRRKALLRQLAVWVGLACACVQLSSALHLLLVEHVRCALHGELVHAEAHPQGGHRVAPRAAAPGGAVLHASRSEADHGHEHCQVVSELRRLAVLPSAVPELSASQLAIASQALFAPARFCVPCVYSYAPKTSPPV